jgi:hypothetical protein
MDLISQQSTHHSRARRDFVGTSFGVLCFSAFLHNCSHTIMKANRFAAAVLVVAVMAMTVSSKISFTAVFLDDQSHQVSCPKYFFLLTMNLSSGLALFVSP